MVAERVYEATSYRHSIPSFVNRYLVTPPQRMRSRREELPGGGSRTMGQIDTPKGILTFASEYDADQDTTWQTEYPVKSPDDIEKIAAIDWELPPALAPPDVDELGDDPEGRRIVDTRISSPFVCVAGMMPFQMFLELAVAEPDLVDELTETCRRRILDILGVVFRGPGIEYVWIGGSEWVTPPMASPAVYDRLVQEQEKGLIGYVKANSEAVVHVHCHGHVRHAISQCIERGADYTEPVEPPPDGDVTMAEAKILAGGRITVGGNVECRVLCNESTDAVERATRAAFEGGKGRFILRPTEGPSPRLGEQELANYLRMVEVWEELSPI